MRTKHIKRDLHSLHITKEKKYEKYEYFYKNIFFNTPFFKFSEYLINFSSTYIECKRGAIVKNLENIHPCLKYSKIQVFSLLCQRLRSNRWSNPK